MIKVVPKNIAMFKVWLTGNCLMCMAYTEVPSKGHILAISPKAIEKLAQVVNQTLVEGKGFVRPFMCQDSFGWVWEACNDSA